MLASERRDDGVARHVPATEKQPEVRLIPCANVEVADPLMVVVESPLLAENTVVEALVRVVLPETFNEPPMVALPLVCKVPAVVLRRPIPMPPVKYPDPATDNEVAGDVVPIPNEPAALKTDESDPPVE